RITPHFEPQVRTVGEHCERTTRQKRFHSPNTYSTVALRCSLSSGMLSARRLASGLRPEAIATYCLPLNSKVIGGAAKGEPTLIFHSSSSVASSKAAPVPSKRPTNTRPPPVASVPEVFG